MPFALHATAFFGKTGTAPRGGEALGRRAGERRDEAREKALLVKGDTHGPA
ncbi:hypothetical protein [Bradyrhizobium cajani]|uniref:Uncharacterized protein n=1 Tax=Bradyrhizobium cajani TaxID=1928661 RepID=A0A844TH69_9BRAD|nr:hypothetical protein [Bradyrhizobium cajani]MCP3374797.1 hypothetical protein [Bradyrhizobium cajani]MVT74732.1 hypothetical protein [Bradyrhizobium cajani]